MVDFGSIALYSLHARGRLSDSIPDSKRVRLRIRLPCGSYGAGSPTAVVCGRNLVSCGNGGTRCRSRVETRGQVNSVCTFWIISLVVCLLRVVRF